MIEIIVATFLIFLVIREKQHAKEVELLSRALIAKNVYELKESQERPSKQNVQDVVMFPAEEEISDDQFMAAIRKQLKAETPQDKFKNKIKKLWPIKSTPQE
jgi:hypothetical protein